jgi:tetratricopeptide (TPR) repeat protein
MRGFIQWISGRFDEAVDSGRSSVNRDPEFAMSHVYYGQELMAVGGFEEAVRHLEIADQLMVDAHDVRATLALALLRGGNVARAAQIDGEVEDAARSRYVHAYQRALLKDALGMRDAAVALLEQSSEDHSHWFALAAVDPRLEALRTDSRVQNLMRRLRR